MPKKESSNKAREWERDRRERLNETFNLLGTLLPSYDPSVTRSKIEILQKAAAYISDLQKENRELVKNGKDQACWKQVRLLKLRIENLLRRIQQLAHLLHDAGISIPPELPKDGQPTLLGRVPKWSNKLRQEDAPVLLEKIKNKKGNKKKERTSLNLCGAKEGCNGEKVINVSDTSNVKVISTTSKRKLSQVSRTKKKMSKEGVKQCATVNKSCNKLPTVTQLLGLSLNDIDIAPPPSLLPASGDVSAKNLTVVTSNTSGTNVTVLASNIPEVPQGFIVIPKASSMPTTSKSQLPQSSCLVMAPVTQTVSCNQNIQQPCVVMSPKPSKVMKASLPIQQSVPIVLSSTTSALESIAIQAAQKSDVAVTNSHLLTAPIMATGIQAGSAPAVLPQGRSLSGLGPGTLILANGSIVPIFPSPQPVSTVPRLLKRRDNSQIVMSTDSHIPTSVLPSQPVLLVQNKTNSTSDAINMSNMKPRRMYSLCLPKPLKRKTLDTTRCTYANKVPISALKSWNHLVVHSSLINSPVVANKRGNKLEIVKKGKRITDKKITVAQKGTGRGSKNISKIKNKRILVTKGEVKNNLQSCENVTKHTKREISKMSSINLSVKENVNEVLIKRSNASDIQVNNSEVHEILNSTKSVEEKCNTEECLITADSQNKRTNEEDDDPKKVMCGQYVDERSIPNDTSSQPPICTSANNIGTQDSLTCFPANEHNQKTNEDSIKMYGRMNGYTVDSITKNIGKNNYPVDVNKDDAAFTMKVQLDETKENEMNSPLSDGINQNTSEMSNNEANISCNVKGKICSDLSYSIPLSTSSILICLSEDNEINKQFLNSSNNSLSSTASENCEKSRVRQNKESVESKQDLYNVTIRCVNKPIAGETLTDLKCVSVDVKTCDVAVVANATNTSHNSKESTSICGVFQQEIDSEKIFSVTSFARSASSGVQLISPKPKEDSGSEHTSLDTSNLQTNFSSEHLNKTIPEMIPEQTLLNASTKVSYETSGVLKDSANDHSILNNKCSKTTLMVEEDSCKKVHKSNNYKENPISIKLQDQEKVKKHEFAEKDRASSEISSSADYNSFSSVSESNSSVCAPNNKMFRSTENLDLGTSTSSSLCLALQNNELSNDLFASLHVPSGAQHAESISPTAAFLMAFPLVSTSKVSDIIGDSQDDVGSDSLQGTSTLLQIGTLDSDHTGAIISRSPTFHNSDSVSKVLPQSPVCQKASNSSSESSRQELECQHLLPPEPNNKIDRNLRKMKIDRVKFSVSHNNLCESDKIGDKNWMSLQDSPQSEATNKIDNETNLERNLDVQSYTCEGHGSQLQNRETTRESSKEKALEVNSTFSVSKEISNVECTSENVNAQSSQQANSNSPSFAVNQFVSSIYEPTPKEHTAVSKKQDNAVQTASVLQINELKSVCFSEQTSRKSENSNFMPAYKSSVINTSNTEISMPGSSSFMGKDVMEQGTMTEVRSSNPISLRPSNAEKQPDSLSFSSTDCNRYSVPSHSGYLLVSSSENEKCNVSSFSVAHNSSNFSILSWTTLSPTSAMANANHYDGFCSQNPEEMATSQNGCSSVPKKQSKGVCPSTVMTSSSVSETCLPSLKLPEQVNNHAINKISESFSSSTLQNTDNQSLESQALIQQYLTDQRKTQNSVVPSNINIVTSQVSQLCSGGKVSDNEQQHRPPVNWMTAPDTRVGQQSEQTVVVSTNSVGDRTHSSSSSAEPVAPIIIVTSKDAQFCSANTQNLCGNCTSTSLPSFDTRTYTSNSFYGSHSVSSHESQSNYYQNQSQPRQKFNICPSYNNSNKLHLTNSLNRITDIPMRQPQVNDTYTIPWLQKKSNASSGCSSELSKSNFVSSSLPTLIGDLALGMNYSQSVNDDEHGNKEPHSINFNVSNSEKKNVCGSGSNSVEEVQEKQVQIAVKNSDQNKDQSVRNSLHEFRNASSQSSTSSFLSVSQLVNQAISCGNPSRTQTVSRPSNISHQIGLSSKQNICQPRQISSRSRQISDLSPTLRESKELVSALNASDKVMNHKTHQDDLSCVNFRPPESSISLTHSGPESSGKLRVQSNQMTGNNNSNYIQEIPSTVTSLSHVSTSFPASSSSQSSSTLASSISWSSDINRQRTVKMGSSNCKAPASSYSAEALIGLNSSQVTDRGSITAQDSRGNKIFTLPPPVVSERFCRHQNFPPPPPPPPPPPSTSRPLQVPPPFNADTILPSNYFAPVELQTHQDASSAGQQTTISSQNNLSSHSHQNQQRFNKFTSSASPSSVRVSAGQCNGVLYSHSDFMSSVGSAHSSHTLPSVSLSCNFLSDLGTNNSYTAGILPDSSNPFLFPSSTITITRGSSVCSNSGGVKPNLTHLHGSTPTGVGISGGHEDANQVLPSFTLGERETYSTNLLRSNNGNSVSHRPVSSETNLLQQNGVVGGSVCNASKQRAKKRSSESVAPSNVTGVGGLMDLGYLGVPPVIASPMLSEDSTFMNHSGGFLTSGSQHAAASLYSGAPTPSQGSFYATSHSQGQSCASLTGSHSGHLTVNSGSFSTQTTRGLQLNTMMSPSTVSSSGTSLTNFNLSTIFPEINEKQVTNHAFNSSGPKDQGPLLSSPLPVSSLTTSAPPLAHPQLNNSSSNHPRQSTTLLLPPVSSYTHRQTAEEASICLPPPPPVPLHSNFNNVLNTTAPQMCQWR